MFQRLFILKGIRTVSHLYKMPKSLEQRGVVSAVDSNAKVKAVLTHSFSTDVGENNRMTVMKAPTAETDMYAKVFTHQRTNVEMFHPIFRKCIESLKPYKGELITIGDYGAAQGTRTLNLFQDSIKYTREKYGNNNPVLIIYNDLPGNDFSALFQRIEATKSFDGQLGGVYVLASGRSMHQQVMPPGSMDIIFISYAILYLSKSPCLTSSGLLSENGTDEERRIWKEAAEKDWEKFLLHRAEELKPGGYLIVSDILTHPTMKITMMFLWTESFDSLLKDRIISKDEYRKATLPAYYRTMEEFRLPFDREDSLVREKGLELLSISQKISVFLEFSEENKAQYSREQYEQDFVNGSLAILHEPLVNCLINRTQPENDSIIEEYKCRLLYNLRANGLDAVRVPRADITIQKKIK